MYGVWFGLRPAGRVNVPDVVAGDTGSVLRMVPEAEGDADDDDDPDIPRALYSFCGGATPKT